MKQYFEKGENHQIKIFIRWQYRHINDMSLVAQMVSTFKTIQNLSRN